MVQLNSKNEVADFLDTNQFIPGRSAYECVAYSAALLKYAGQPRHGPIGSTLEASNLAQYWYGRETGSNTADNTSGMSLAQEYDMLKGVGLAYKSLAASVDAIKAALSQGYPVLFCGAETGMVDVALGDVVPYGWPPSGNHAIVISGIAPDGNLLVHDCASIAPNGVRPGPRTYDASKLQPVSATAIIPAWLSEDNMAIDINSPGVSEHFTETDAQHWTCKQTGKVLQMGILDFYKQQGGLQRLGLPVSNEIALDASGNTRQHFERGALLYDPQHKYDNPPGSGSVYYAHIYTGPCWTAVTADLNAQITTLTSALAQAKAAPANDAALQAVKAIIPIVEPFK